MPRHFIINEPSRNRILRLLKDPSCFDEHDLTKIINMLKNMGSGVIPATSYLEADSFTYVTKDIFYQYHSLEDWNAFSLWMRGQTGGIVNGEFIYYSWDYERWLLQGKQTEQGEDWD